MKYLFIGLLCLTLSACSSNTTQVQPSASPTTTPVTVEINKELELAKKAYNDADLMVAIEHAELALKSEKDPDAKLEIREFLVKLLTKNDQLLKACPHIKVLSQDGKNEKYAAMFETIEAQLWGNVFFPRVIQARELAQNGEIEEARKILKEIQNHCDEYGFSRARIDKELFNLPLP